MARLTRRLRPRRRAGARRLCRADRADRLAVRRAPTGFIPAQDQGYLITVDPAAARRFARPHRRRGARSAKIMRDTPGVAHAVPFAGFDGATFTNASNAGAIFSPFAAVRRARRRRA